MYRRERFPCQFQYPLPFLWLFDNLNLVYHLGLELKKSQHPFIRCNRPFDVFRQFHLLPHLELLFQSQQYCIPLLNHLLLTDCIFLEKT